MRPNEPRRMPSRRLWVAGRLSGPSRPFAGQQDSGLSTAPEVEDRLGNPVVEPLRQVWSTSGQEEPTCTGRARVGETTNAELALPLPDEFVEALALRIAQLVVGNSRRVSHPPPPRGLTCAESPRTPP
jgi:hypothetical protein